MAIFRDFYNVFKHAFFALVLAVFSTAAFGAFQCPTGWVYTSINNQEYCVKEFPGISWETVTGKPNSEPGKCPIGWHTRTYNNVTDCYLNSNDDYFSTSVKEIYPRTSSLFRQFKDILGTKFDTHSGWPKTNGSATVFIRSSKDPNTGSISTTSLLRIITSAQNAIKLIDSLYATRAVLIQSDLKTDTFSSEIKSTDDTRNLLSAVSSLEGYLVNKPKQIAVLDNLENDVPPTVLIATGSCTFCETVKTNILCLGQNGDIKNNCICDQKCDLVPIYPKTDGALFYSCVENACSEYVNNNNKTSICYIEGHLPKCEKGDTCIPNYIDETNIIDSYEVYRDGDFDLITNIADSGFKFPDAKILSRTNYVFSGWKVADESGIIYGPYAADTSSEDFYTDLTWIEGASWNLFTVSPMWRCENSAGNTEFYQSIMSNSVDSTAPSVSVCKTSIHCNAGEYLPADSASCDSCPAGKYCKGGDFAQYVGETQGIDGSVAPGYFSTGGATSSTPNTTVGGEDGDDKNGCTYGYTCGLVAAGYFSTGGATSAEPNTTVGGEAGDGTNGCISGNTCGAVAAGYFSAGGGKVATPTSGTGCISSSTCGVIGAGYFSTGGGKTATPTSSTGCIYGNTCGAVAAGYFSTSGGTSATPNTTVGGQNGNGSNGCISNYRCGLVSAGYFSTGGGKVATPNTTVGGQNGNGSNGCISNYRCGLVSAGYFSTGGGKVATPNTTVGGQNGNGSNGCISNYRCGLVSAGYFSTGGGKVAEPYKGSFNLRNSFSGDLPLPNQGCASSNNTCGAVAAGYFSTGGGKTATPTSSTGCISGNTCGVIAAGYFSTGGGKTATPQDSGYGCLCDCTGSNNCMDLYGCTTLTYQCGVVGTNWYSTCGGTLSPGIQLSENSDTLSPSTNSNVCEGQNCYRACLNNCDCGQVATGYTSDSGAISQYPFNNCVGNPSSCGCANGFEGQQTCSPVQTTITLNANNGSGNNGTIYTTFDTNVYIDSNRTNAMTTNTNNVSVPQKDGAIFVGYYSSSSGGIKYIDENGYITSDGLNAGKGYTTNGNTWYAQFKARVVYLCGNQTTTPTIDSTLYSAGESVTVKHNTCTNSNATFLGWKCTDYKQTFLNNNGVLSVDDSDTTNNSFTIQYDTFCFAQWSCNQIGYSLIQSPLNNVNMLEGTANNNNISHDSWANQGKAGGTYPGIVTGLSRCSTSSGTTTGDVINQGPSETTGQNCWCKVTGYQPPNQANQTIDFLPWVYLDNASCSPVNTCSEACSKYTSGSAINGQSYSFEVVIWHTTLYTGQKCSQNIINLNWIKNNGSEPDQTTCTYDSSITIPTQPTKTGYVFKGWRVVQNNTP